MMRSYHALLAQSRSLLRSLTPKEQSSSVSTAIDSFMESLESGHEDRSVFIERYLTGFINHMKDEQLPGSHQQLVVLDKKLEGALEIGKKLLSAPTDSLYNLPDSHERWSKVNNHVSFIPDIDEDQIEKNVQLHRFIYSAYPAAYFHITDMNKNPFVTREIYKKLNYFSHNKEESAEFFKYALAHITAKDFVDMMRSLESQARSPKVLEKFGKVHIEEHVIDKSAPEIDYFTYKRTGQLGSTGQVKVKLLSREKLTKKPEKIIVYFHPGGFSTLSTSFQEPLLRPMTLKLDVPVLSVDYSLAPEKPFPEALIDCYNAYNWVVRHYDPEVVVLMGDSAGGNLALSTALSCALGSVRRPDGLFLAYPSSTVNPNRFTPYLLEYLDDFVTPFSTLDGIYGLYSAHTPKENWFLSPADSPILAELPKTKIIVGTKDGLYGDCVVLTERLASAGVEVETKAMQGMIHAALNFNMPSVLPEVDTFREKTFSMLSELLNN